MPYTSAKPDPFTAGYDILIQTLKGGTAFMAAAGRFTDWSDGTTTKPLQAILPADTPEITLIQGAWTFSPYGPNSLIAEVDQTYTLVAVTDSLQIASANAIKWALGGAIYKADLEKCTWNGNPFIRDFNVVNSTDGTTGVKLPGLPGDTARGVDRITSIAAIQLMMFVPRSSLPA